ncbi:MAG TPA: RNA methyltransferase [Vicinamibacterales bacterium]|nr:RNA methyltransferase [Vicinamibacterales bacterium]
MIVPVAGHGDPGIADYAHVGDHAWLHAHGLFVAEGRLVVRRLLAAGRFPLQSILLTPAALRDFGAAIDTDAPVYLAGPDILNQVTGIDFHRGCLALARRPAEDDDAVAGRFAGAKLLLAIEGVGNPDNVGGLFRVAWAFGAAGLLLDPATGDPFYRKAVRTSMGAVLQLPFARVRPWPSALEAFKAIGFRIVALTPAADAVSLDGFAGEGHGPLVVLVGAEGRGLSEAALRAADIRVRIPIAPDVDSLNVTVAAGIALSRLSG